MTLVHRLNYIIVCCDTHGPFEQYSINFIVEGMKIMLQFAQSLIYILLYYYMLIIIYIYPGISFIEINPIN